MERRVVIVLGIFILFGIGALTSLRSPDKGDHGPRQRPVPAMKSDDVTKIELTSQKGEHTVLEKGADGWHITAPQAWPADANAVNMLTVAISKQTFADIVTESAEKHKDLGVDDQASAKIKVTSPAGTFDMILGNTVGGFQMLRLAGKNEVWQSNNLFLYQINKPTKDWRDHTVTSLAIAEVDHLTVEQGANKLVLDRNADKKSWTVKESTGDAPKPEDAIDHSMPATVAQAIGSMRASDFADDKAPKDAGLEPPVERVTVTANGKDTTIEIGALEGDDNYVRVAGLPQIYKVKKYLIERVAYRPVDYRDKTLLAMKEPAKIVVVNGKVTTTLVRENDKWALQPAGPLDDGKAKAFAGGVDALVGSSILTDKTIDAGLAKPRSTITATPKSGAPQTVKIGAMSADGQDYYAQRAGGKDIVVVKKFAVDRLLKGPGELAPSAKPAGKPGGMPGGMPPGMMPPGMMPPGMPH